MVTDDDRAFAYEQSERIYAHHLERGTEFLRFHTSSNISYMETVRRGILTECAFANEFGGLVSRELSHYGDGGADFWLDLRTETGARRYPVDVKSKSVRVSWEGLRRSGTHLRVLKREIRPLTIYVFGIYLELTDDAEVLRWTWGDALLKLGQLRLFENSTSDENWNYTMPFDDLRSLDELKSRM